MWNRSRPVLSVANCSTTKLGRTAPSNWSNDDYKCFIDYYKAIAFAAFSRLQKKYQPKTAHNAFFLILYEMGMEDKDVRRIMGITQEAIRSTRYRIVQNGRK